MTFTACLLDCSGTKKPFSHPPESLSFDSRYLAPPGMVDRSEHGFLEPCLAGEKMSCDSVDSMVAFFSNARGGD